MHPESSDKKTKYILEKIGGNSLSKDFYLAGGTALALQLGHRQSIDLDWFSGQDFLNEKIKKNLVLLGNFKLLSEEKDTIHGTLDEIRVSFFHYGYKLLFPLIKFENIDLADERDIAAMKIDAISSRGSKKDFIDLYFLLKKYSLAELIDFFEKKYKNIKYNKLHILKSFSYFDDAENEPMPMMIRDIEWGKIKEVITDKVKKLLDDEGLLK
ncbi:MAG: nucleotidyl transferase AbiEii/AbiGii toxin family protein [bacterium]|nr:nucleotidyl transferase AbiEii/AbiGii toxin family protein [bacterium]